MGRKAGISEQQFLDLATFEESDAFSVAEKLTLRLASAMTRTPVTIDDELFLALRAQFSQEQIVELCTAIAWENHRARFNRAFDVQAEGFSERLRCAPPTEEP